uniref:Uncharacterized protein n=1 Tax=Romanomermis culicivorax TaxID=13658 RepID=A0A915I6A8_ROMCU
MGWISNSGRGIDMHGVVNWQILHDLIQSPTFSSMRGHQKRVLIAANDGMNIGVGEKISTDDTLIVSVIVKNYTLDHMFTEWGFHCDDYWTVDIDNGAIGHFDFTTYRELEQFLLNVHLTRPEDNTEHWALVLMSACALTAPSLMGIWKACVEAYLRMKVFGDGVRLSIWQMDERM